jgi:hypothetical protein
MDRSVSPGSLENLFQELSQLPAGSSDMAQVMAICGHYGVTFLQLVFCNLFPPISNSLAGWYHQLASAVKSYKPVPTSQGSLPSWWACLFPMSELLTLSPPPVATAPSQAARCPRLLGYHKLALGLVAGFIFGGSWLLWRNNWLMPLRVGVDAEAMGLDLSQPGKSGLPPTMPVAELREVWLTADEVAESLPALRWIGAKS